LKRGAGKRAARPVPAPSGRHARYHMQSNGPPSRCSAANNARGRYLEPAHLPMPQYPHQTCHRFASRTASRLSLGILIDTALAGVSSISRTVLPANWPNDLAQRDRQPLGGVVAHDQPVVRLKHQLAGLLLVARRADQVQAKSRHDLLGRHRRPKTAERSSSGGSAHRRSRGFASGPVWSAALAPRMVLSGDMSPAKCSGPAVRMIHDSFSSIESRQM